MVRERKSANTLTFLRPAFLLTLWPMVIYVCLLLPLFGPGRDRLDANESSGLEQQVAPWVRIRDDEAGISS